MDIIQAFIVRQRMNLWHSEISDFVSVREMSNGEQTLDRLSLLSLQSKTFPTLFNNGDRVRVEFLDNTESNENWRTKVTPSFDAQIVYSIPQVPIELIFEKRDAQAMEVMCYIRKCQESGIGGYVIQVEKLATQTLEKYRIEPEM